MKRKKLKPKTFFLQTKVFPALVSPCLTL